MNSVQKVAIVGSRKYPYLQDVVSYVMKLPQSTIIVSGGAEGVDKTAVETARQRNMQVLIFFPDWIKYGRGAGYKRNILIIQACDRLVAFWHEQSRGTAISLKLARDMKKPLEVHFS